MEKAEEYYIMLDNIRRGTAKPSEIGKVVIYLREYSPVHYDRIFAAMAEARSRLADDIMHANMSQSVFDRRQTKINF